MNMQSVDQVTESLQVGRYYLVPCIKVRKGMEPCLFREGQWVPVVGLLHRDPLINADFPHHHIDWRFVESNLVPSTQIKDGNGSVVIQDSWIISFGVFGVHGTTYRHYQDADIQYRRRKCRRTLLISGSRFAYAREKPLFNPVRVLEREFAGCRAECDRCPHQGLPLNGLAIEHDGAVTCLGHGLRWHYQAKELIPFRE